MEARQQAAGPETTNGAAARDKRARNYDRQRNQRGR